MERDTAAGGIAVTFAILTRPHGARPDEA